MFLQNLHLVNYRNYEDIMARFDSKVNVLIGPNGSGKTNLLDAIYYLSFTRSAFQSTDQLNVRHGADHFFIMGSFLKEGRQHGVSVGYQPGMRKSFQEDGSEYQKLSEHLGKYPAVLIAPDDVELVKAGSEVRRKFFDSLIAQVDKRYLDNLIQYSQALKQRNGLLRLFSEKGTTDNDAIESFDEVLIRVGQPLFEKRRSFINDFIPVFNSHFNYLMEQKDTTSVQYFSDLDSTSFVEGLQRNRRRDLALQRTTFGVHRDDYLFQLGHKDIKKYGSQGQQKSFVIALKLTQWQILKEMKGFKPLLLLDDIFDRLDEFRINSLLELIEDFGQLFITDARSDRSDNVFRKMVTNAEVFEVNSGQIKQLL